MSSPLLDQEAQAAAQFTPSEMRFAWLAKSANFIAEYSSELLVLLATTFAAFSSFQSLAETVASWHWLQSLPIPVSGFGLQVTGFVLAVASSATGIVVAERRKKSRSALERQIDRLSRSRIQDLSTLHSVLKDALEDFSIASGLWSESVRASLYRHNSDRKEFVRLARVSSNPRLKTVGRAAYPDDKGFISTVWTKGSASIRDLPDDRDEWNKSLVRTDRFMLVEAQLLTMHSRSMCGIRLDYDGESVGMIIVESLNPRGVQGTVLDDLKASDWPEKISMLFAVSRANIDNLSG